MNLRFSGGGQEQWHLKYLKHLSSVAVGFHPHASIDKESTQDLFEKYLLANFAGQAKEEMLRQKPIRSILLIIWTIRWDHSRLKYKICNTHASTIKQCSRKLLWFNHLASDTYFFQMPRSMRQGCSSTGGLSLSPSPTSGSSSLLETSTFAFLPADASDKGFSLLGSLLSEPPWFCFSSKSNARDPWEPYLSVSQNSYLRWSTFHLVLTADHVSDLRFLQKVISLPTVTIPAPYLTIRVLTPASKHVDSPKSQLGCFFSIFKIGKNVTIGFKTIFLFPEHEENYKERTYWKY